jgi:hypothetical protein
MPDNRIVIHAGECLFAQFPRIIFIGSSRASPRSASPDACGKLATSVLPGVTRDTPGSIRERRLYKEKGYKTFEAYCREVWGWSKRHANRQIAASEAVAKMGPIGPAPPSNEARVRPLARIENPQERAEVWEEVVEEAAAAQSSPRTLNPTPTPPSAWTPGMRPMGRIDPPTNEAQAHPGWQTGHGVRFPPQPR